MSSRWLFSLSILFFIVAMVVFGWVTRAPDYMGKNPATCNNCHVMDSQYENWFHAPHAEWATCSDCHIPHDNLVDYYYYKGKSGMRDVFSFVMHIYPVAIRANTETVGILQDNCVRCHLATVEGILNNPMPLDRNCWDCHRSVAHGKRGLTLAPYQDSEVYGK